MKLVRMATPGIVRADTFDQLQEDVAGCSALHALQHRGAGMLQRHVDVLDQRGVLRDRIEQLLGDLVRIGVEETHPFRLRRFDLRQAGEQLRQTVFEAEIFAVAGGVLADQIDLAHALREEARRFRNHRFEAAAAEFAAILRDHAEGAGMIAAFGDLDVREVARSGENARREVVIEIRARRRAAASSMPSQTATMRSISLVPMSASTSGMSFRMSPR